MKKISRLMAAFLLLIVPVLGFSGIKEGQFPSEPNGGNPSKSFVDGAFNYFVMFNSLLDDTKDYSTQESAKYNGDVCIASSKFQLTDTHIPVDAIGETAYVTWMEAVDPSKLNAAPNNKVHIKFTSADGKTVIETDAIGESKTNATTEEHSFGYEAISYEDNYLDPKDDCSTQATTELVKATVAYYTYRVEVTSFFAEILKAGRALGKFDGDAYLGTYEVSRDVNACTAHSYYKCRTTMVSNWAIFFVYVSEKVSAKKVYFYNGLAAVNHNVQDINISGFEFPLDASVRLSFMVAEGDSANQTSMEQLDNGSKIPAKYPENVFIKGPEASEPYALHDICNEEKTQTTDVIPVGYFYTEIYNSNSSIPNFDGTSIECRKGQKGTDIYYGVDVDTFILNKEVDATLTNHLTIGQESLKVTMSVNQDMIFTNFIALAIDTKTPTWDIPNKREKDVCSCSTQKDKVCSDRGFYYTIEIKNSGQNIAKNVTLEDTLPSGDMKYVPGTTTIYKDEKWTAVADDAGGVFPYKSAKVVVAEMLPTDKSIWVKFKVEPVGTTFPKAGVLENWATIKSTEGDAYKTNSRKALVLRVDNSCVPIAQCADADPKTCPAPEGCVGADCGGGGGDDKTASKDAQLVVTKGLASPVDATIEKDSKNLVLSQITVTPTEASAKANKGKSYTFAELTTLLIKNPTSDTNLNVSNFRLIDDANNNGLFETTERVIAEGVNTNNNIKFSMKANFTADSVHNFLVVADVGYNGKVASKVTLQTRISEGNLKFIDSGTPKATVSPTTIDFAIFKLELDDVFIFTSGLSMAGKVGADVTEGKTQAVFHIRMKDKTTSGAAVKSILINVDETTGAGFGSGVDSIALYNSDATGKKGSLISAGNINNSGVAEFANLNIKPAKPGENYYYLVEANFSLSTAQSAVFTIFDGDVTVSPTAKIDGLPMSSNEFGPGDGVESPPSCGCSVVASSSTTGEMAGIVFMAMIALFAAFRVAYARSRK